MKRIVAVLALVGALVAGLDVVGDATQDRPDEVRADSSTTVVFDVATRRAKRSDADAAHALWAVCSHTIDSEIVEGLVETGDGYLVTVAPALGEHGRRRLTGCLEDATVDRVLGNVVEVRST